MDGKSARIAVAAAVAGTLLILILLAVMSYQLIKIAVEKNREKELAGEKERLEQLISETRDGIETRSQKWWVEQRARELGYLYGTDFNLGE